MIGEVVRKLAQNLDELIDERGLGDPFLSSHNYTAKPLGIENFNPIKSVESNRKIAFIDGGNQPLVEAPNFSIQLNRVYFNLFSGRRAVQPSSLPQRVEFFSATVAKFRKEQIYYDTEILPLDDKLSTFLPDARDLSFSSMDRRIMAGTGRADIARVATIARRFAEWELARHVTREELGENDVLVMDGTLRTAFTNEAKYARAAYAESKNRGVVYSGLSKTCRLFTTTGLSLLGALRKLAADNDVAPMWYYYPIAESMSPEHEASIFIVKLNSQSPRAFRYEIQSQQASSLTPEAMNEIMSQLATNSSDIEFPGYPYGLIDADDNARVRYEEVEAYKVMLLSEVSKLGASAKFLRHMQSTDSHDVLNMMRGSSYE